MQSKTSSFKTVVIKNLTRFWPLWGLATFICLMVPMAIVVNDGLRPTPSDGASYYLEAAAHAGPGYCLVMSIFAAMVVWSYLYTPKSVGLMHSLPISRKKLFYASYLSGLLMTLIPACAAGLLLTIFEIVTGSFSFVPFITAAAVLILEAFFFFSFATFLAHITSNIIALPILYYILNFLAVIIEYVVSIYCRLLCFGLTDTENSLSYFLSPVCEYYSKVE
ncbi:MAG: hypothetical protein K6E19_06080, partial [Lachnospiraceae bacterium]|nr:hypothetical protein [Lachnospiraceae bacterium]